jgi:hypothetical protein
MCPGEPPNPERLMGDGGLGHAGALVDRLAGEDVA